MRPATLEDVENATSWDAETVKALMGTGCLYVLRTATMATTSPTIGRESTESESQDEGDEESMLHLAEMFPTVSREDIESAFYELGFTGAVDKLLGGGPIADCVLTGTTSQYGHSSSGATSSSTTSQYGHSSSGATSSSTTSRYGHSSSGATSPSTTSRYGHSSSGATSSSTTSDAASETWIVVDPELQCLEHILRSHAASTIGEQEYKLLVDRSSDDSLRNAALAFYKSAKVKPQKLRREFVVEFVGEVGVDSGSLRKEFLEAAISQANSRLFEGEPGRHVPKKDWGLELMFELCGMMIGHSVLQEGPGLPCLSPCIYDYMVHEELDQCYPVKEDIPLNILTHELITFIEEMSDASSEDEIDHIIDKPANSYILNGCGWSITEPIVPSNKFHFLQHLMLDEVILKCERNLKALLCGLGVLGIVNVVRHHPAITKKLFVAEETPLTSHDFMKLIFSMKPNKVEEIQAFEFFKDFVSSLEDCDRADLPCLLKFVTGLSSVPPMGLEFPIQLSYLAKDDKETLPKAQACFSKLFLPTIHSSKEQFVEAFLKALEFGFEYGIT